ncbi:hypothetical protein C6P46_000511 [Rhodotorula mucilaginosa]|uniref:Mitochondrial import inner membrane translocase subunit TIM23 n=1 Tax=Rhodotorula mucilaginosa TaxID=5537 RepID=A0A9P6VV91_RHOMI|nr:hypothetical protein C6P46_000511 [Rhodotorula mucilaginosa]
MATAAAPAPNADDILGQHRFVTPTGAPAASGPSSSPYAPTASSILAGTSLDAAALHPLAGVVDNKELDYLLLEDDKLSSVAGGKTVLPSRGWGDELCYGTGSTYLAGLGLGGAWGFVEGFRRPIAAARQAPAVAPAAAAAAGAGAAPTAQAIGAQATAFAKEAASAVTAASTTEGGAAAAAARPAAGAGAAAQRVSARLRWNNVLNQVTRRGTSMGNSAGVLALIYNGINSTIDVYRGHVHDMYGSMAAAALTGLIWRSTAGIKSMVVTSSLLTVGAAGWSWFKVQLL